MNTIGFSISGHFNDTEMYSADDSALLRCPICGFRLNFEAYDPDYSFKKSFKPAYMTDMKISMQTAATYTYDGQVIVTKPFKEFCEIQGYEDLVFRSFPKDPWHFQIVANRKLEVEQTLSKIRFGKKCSGCGNYDYTVLTHDVELKAAPLYVKSSDPLPDGFYRTDILFANGNGKHPILIVGLKTRSKLKAAKFKGVIFHPVYAVEA